MHGAHWDPAAAECGIVGSELDLFLEHHALESEKLLGAHSEDDSAAAYLDVSGVFRDDDHPLAQSDATELSFYTHRTSLANVAPLSPLAECTLAPPKSPESRCSDELGCGTDACSVNELSEMSGPKGAIGKKRARRSRLQQHPSRFCHVCQRKEGSVRLVVCANLASGVCRKVTCEVCFRENGWDFETAVGAADGWQCTHCRDECPVRAQCKTYMRTNDRRRQTTHKRRLQKTMSESLLSIGLEQPPAMSLPLPAFALHPVQYAYAIGVRPLPAVICMSEDMMEGLPF